MPYDRSGATSRAAPIGRRGRSNANPSPTPTTLALAVAVAVDLAPDPDPSQARLDLALTLSLARRGWRSWASYTSLYLPISPHISLYLQARLAQLGFVWAVSEQRFEVASPLHLPYISPISP